MTKIQLKKISNLIFWITTAFAVVTLAIVGKDYLTMAGQGVCVISQNNTLIYTALGLLLGSIVITSILDAKVKKMTDEKTGDIYDQTLAVLKNEDLAETDEEAPAADGLQEPVTKQEADDLNSEVLEQSQPGEIEERKVEE